MGRPNTNSVRWKLTGMTVFSSAAALLLACVSFLVHELLTFRESMVRDLLTEAQVLASNSAAPILFDDEDTARQTLAAVKADRHVLSVTITDPSGKTFASYVRKQPSPSEATPGVPLTTTHRFTNNRLILSVPVPSDGTTVGTLSIESDLGKMVDRINRYVLLTVLVLFVSIIAAVVIAARLQRRILDPILQLTATAKTVSRDRDYSVRASVAGDDELALLSRTFNQMLGQIEEQNKNLQQAVRMRDDFLSIASHELKTPLTPLLLHLQRLAKETEDTHASGLLPRIQVIDRQVRRLAKLVDSLLDIARLTAGKLDLELEQVDLSALVVDVVQRFQSEAARSGSELVVSTVGPVVGQWDRLRLEQVVANLVSNALKYGAGKPISLSVGERDDAAVVTIRDQGIGIPASDLERIFGRFERAVSGRHYGGFGLGLWIVRQILEGLGGKIRAESAPGEGASFVVELPRNHVAPVVEAPVVAAPEPP